MSAHRMLSTSLPRCAVINFFPQNCWESRASGFVAIRLRRLDVPTDPVLSLLRVLRLLPGDPVNHQLATYEDGPGHLGWRYDRSPIGNASRSTPPQRRSRSARRMWRPVKSKGDDAVTP